MEASAHFRITRLTEERASDIRQSRWCTSCLLDHRRTQQLVAAEEKSRPSPSQMTELNSRPSNHNFVRFCFISEFQCNKFSNKCSNNVSAKLSSFPFCLITKWRKISTASLLNCTFGWRWRKRCRESWEMLVAFH